MSKHTEGPWTIRGPKTVDMADDFAIIADGEIIGEAFGRSDVSKFHPSRANAKLMAMAPRMYAALKAISTNPHLNLGDLVYTVREHEFQGWDGPAVKQWSDAVTEVESILKTLDE